MPVAVDPGSWQGFYAWDFEFLLWGLGTGFRDRALGFNVWGLSFWP